MLRRPVCLALLTALLIAACGGSSHSSSSASSASSASSTTSTASPATNATSTVSAGPSTTTATTSARPPEVPKNRALRHSSKPTVPNTNVRIPAAFVIRAGGGVTPPLISVPAHVTVELELHNEGAKARTVQLSVPNAGAAAVPAHGVTTITVTGLSKGTYRLLVDRVARARIVIGAVPGP
jgi:hypothetical protein